MSGMSQRAYARHRGVTHRAVQKAIASGRITTMPDGSIDPAAADAAWARNTDETKAANSVSGDPKHRRPEGSPPIPAGASAPATSRVRAGGSSATGTQDAGQSGVAAGYTAARALRETYAARRERLRFEKETGALVPVDDVRLAAFNTARRVRDLLLAVPDRIAPVLAATDDTTSCHRIVGDEIRRALQELSA